VSSNSLRAPDPEQAEPTVKSKPVAPPPNARPAPVKIDQTPVHRWPTEQESVSLPEPESPQPVTVAALANSAPYDPTQATVATNTAAQYPTSNSTHANSAAPDPTEERTRNGLVKRQPRHRGTTAGRPTASPMPARHTAAESAHTERSPADVGTMLSAFRRGHQRGELNGRHSNGDEPAPSHVEREEEPGVH
jgi:hypothetical protein